MKTLLYLIIFLGASCINAQVDVSQFTMENPTSPAFVLVEETPTAIYTPDNIKALSLHVLDNLGESLSIEVAAYYFLNTKKEGRTYAKYIGVYQDTVTKQLKQNPWSGINTTTVSFAYVEKEFAGIETDKKTFSIGMRTTLLRFYDKQKVHDNATAIAQSLASLEYPTAILSQGEEAIRDYAINQQKVNAIFEPFQKTIKPVFQVDAALGYSALFKENTTDSGTVNRFGSWLTAAANLPLNEGSGAAYNNYFSAFITARYIEDGFNIAETDSYFTNYYRDVGGKVAVDLGKFSFGYEYISRNGSIDGERSVGQISYRINKDISIIGGFGKDFPADDNLITLFGVNWGVNVGKSVTQ